MRVGRLDRVALEETLVDGVEELLLLAEILQRVGGVFDGAVEAVQRLEEVVAIEAQADQGVDDLLNFGGDDVAARELRVVENLVDEL